ncbi:hypothetical protein FBU30_001334 [Linnemannia zychae]|nr:hypothetical protein FBU30_001334 [Linnemannia zychae]
MPTHFFFPIKITMSFKSTFVMLFALVVLLVASISQTEAVTVPIWCVCGTQDTQLLCRVVAGKWDGSSCGMITTSAYENFAKTCPIWKGTTHCWN